MNGQIKISITKEEESANVVQDAKTTKVESTDLDKRSMQSQAIATALIQGGKQIIASGVNTYSNLTGDYIVSRGVQSMTNLAADALTMVKGGVVGVIMVGTKYAIQGVQSVIDYRKQEAQLNFLRQRTGNSTINGGRYR